MINGVSSQSVSNQINSTAEGVAEKESAVDKILKSIFRNLNAKQLGMVAQVCKKWYEISSGNEKSSNEIWQRIWKRMNPGNENVPQQIKEDVIEQIQNIISYVEQFIALPDDSFPQFQEKIVHWSFARDSVWLDSEFVSANISQEYDFEEDSKKIEKITSSKEVSDLFNISVKAFESCTYLAIEPIGLNTLSICEKIAFKIEKTFQNPAPFRYLAIKYQAMGMEAKAIEMNSLVVKYDRGNEL